MNNKQHRAVFLSNNSHKEKFVQQLIEGHSTGDFSIFNNQQGALFSEIALIDFINEEVLHERYDVVEDKTKSLRFLSGGEQRKALLSYLLSQKPQFMIIDNPFDYLDVAAQANLKQQLTEIAEHTTLIQLINRKHDWLPFIDKAVELKESDTFSDVLDIPLFVQAFEHEDLQLGAIPPPVIAYAPITGPLIVFDRVSVSYGNKPILHEIEWVINPGDFWQLKGPNGSGKSTMLSLITGDNPKGYGQQLFLFGRKKGSGETVWEIKQKIGYFTTAMTDLFGKEHTVEQMIISGLHDSIGLYSKATPLELKSAHEWLAAIGLLAFKKMAFHKVSLGQQRLVLIARAMIKHPPLLILDEPTSGLDDHNVELVAALVNKIAAESNTTILYVSHRTEVGLTPRFIFSLKPSNDGSIGFIEAINS